MSNNINLNVNPYYDDYDANKQYERILFKPGYAVQARELTQLQTILQEQIGRFGDNIFKEGAVVTGCDYALNLRVPYVKVLDTPDGIITSPEITNAVFETYEGETLVNSTTGLKAIIKKATRGFETSTHKTFHVQYLNQGTNGTTTSFAPDDVLNLVNVDGTINLSVQFKVAGSGTSPVGFGSLFSLGNGIIYAKGTFIVHKEQTVVLESFSSSPTRSVGVNVVETIIGSDSDSSLLDPASGTYNYTAPGADRLKVETELRAYDPDAGISEDFNVLFEVVNGQVARRYDVTNYGELSKVLARRTYDESGDYTTRPFDVTVREHLLSGNNGGVYTSGNGGSASKLAVGVSPGKAYVKGYEYQTYTTQYFPVDKETTTRELSDATVSTAYGYYVLVNELCGYLDVQAGTQIMLYDDVQTAVTSTNFSAESLAGNIIGTARVLSIEYETGTIGTATTQYRLYLYDIQITGAGKTFADVRSFYYNTGATGDFIADIATTPAALLGSSYGSLLFPFSTTQIKETKLTGVSYDNSYVYKKLLSGNTVSGTGNVTFQISASGEEFAFTDTQSTDTRNNKVMLIAGEDINNSSAALVYKQGRVIPVGESAGATTAAITSIDNASPTKTITFSISNATFGATSYNVQLLVSVRRSDKSPTQKTRENGRLVKIQLENTLTGSGSSGSPTITTASSYTSDSVAVGDKIYWNRALTGATSGDVTIGGTTITGNGSALYSTELAAGDLIITSAGTFVGTVVSAGSASSATITPAVVAVASGSTLKAYKLAGTVSALPTNTTITLSSNLTFAIPSSSTLIISHPSYNVATKSLNGSLCLGLPDVFKVNYVKIGSSSDSFATINSGTTTTDAFVLNNGQTDVLYDLASLSKNPKESFNFTTYKRLVVSVDYLKHDLLGTDGGFYTVDSYPLPAQGSTANATQIEWTEIPRYVAPNGSTRELRNMLDFRLTVNNTATDTTTLASATLNPATTKAFAPGVIYTPVSRELFTTDLQYNLGRVDRVILNSEGEFEILKGVADPAPIAPKEPANVMSLATLLIPPFPSVSPKVAKTLNRPIFSAVVNLFENKRFTMRDIANIENRLMNLEKITQLSFLEQRLLNTSFNNRVKNGILVDDFNDHNGGNIDDPNYSCNIFNGNLQPNLNPMNVGLEVSAMTNLVRTPKDVHVLVEQLVTAYEYQEGGTATNGLGASGTIKHVVTLATDYATSSPGYRWVRLYLENATGTFAAGNTINQTYQINTGSGTTNVTATGTSPSNINLVNRIATSVLPLTLRPDAVVYPATGNLITLPYNHKVYTENPYASEAINTSNILLFKYEGNISLQPMSDPWFDEENAPEGDSFALPTGGSTSWFSTVLSPTNPAIASPAAAAQAASSSSDLGTGYTGYGSGGTIVRWEYNPYTGAMEANYESTQFYLR